MMPIVSAKGRIVAVVVGIGCAAVILLGVAYWKDVVAAYHLRRLQRDPGHLLHLVTEPVGTPERQAVRRFIGTPAGKRGLLTSYIDQIKRSVPQVAKNLSKLEQDPHGLKTEFWVCERMAYEFYQYEIPRWSIRGGGGSTGIGVPRAEREMTIRRLRSIQELLIEVGYQDYALPSSHPHLRFDLILYNDSGRPPKAVAFDSIYGSTIDYLVVVRKIGRSEERNMFDELGQARDRSP